MENLKSHPSYEIPRGPILTLQSKQQQYLVWKMLITSLTHSWWELEHIFYKCPVEGLNTCLKVFLTLSFSMLSVFLWQQNQTLILKGYENFGTKMFSCVMQVSVWVDKHPKNSRSSWVNGLIGKSWESTPSCQQHTSCKQTMATEAGKDLLIPFISKTSQALGIPHLSWCCLSLKLHLWLALPVGHPHQQLWDNVLGKDRGCFQGWWMCSKLAAMKYPRNGQKKGSVY